MRISEDFFGLEVDVKTTEGVVNPTSRLVFTTTTTSKETAASRMNHFQTGSFTGLSSIHVFYGCSF